MYFGFRNILSTMVAETSRAKQATPGSSMNITTEWEGGADECLSSREHRLIEGWESTRWIRKVWVDIVVCVLQSICRRI